MKNYKITYGGALIGSAEKKAINKVINKGELPAMERECQVVSTRLLAGRTVVRVFADSAPGADFEAVAPDLEDVYFSAMAGYLGRRQARAAAGV